MTQSAVSYQIKTLESYVGGPLFIRKARGVELSDRGQALAPIVHQSLRQIEQALTSARDRNEGMLVVTAVPTFAINLLVPRIGSFQLANPGLAVRIESSGRTVDLSTEGFDVGIRSGKGKWPGLVSHGLFDVSFTPMCSPAYLAREGAITHPSDLLDRTLADPNDPWWQVWFKKAGVEVRQDKKFKGVAVDTQHFAASIAVNGHGIAILTPQLVKRELESGSLVTPFDISVVLDDKYYLVYPETLRSSRKIRLFRDWIVSEIASSGANPGRTRQASSRSSRRS